MSVKSTWGAGDGLGGNLPPSPSDLDPDVSLLPRYIFLNIWNQEGRLNR